jgi:hypothetical protein
MFREAGQRRLSTIMYGAGVAGVTVAAVADALMFGGVQLIGFVAPASVQTLYAVSFFIYIKLFWFFAALALATALATWRSAALPAWYAVLSALGGVIFIAGGVSVRKYGFLSPEGAMPFIAFVAIPVWAVVSSALLVIRLGSVSRTVAPTSAPSPT